MTIVDLARRVVGLSRSVSKIEVMEEREQEVGRFVADTARAKSLLKIPEPDDLLWALSADYLGRIAKNTMSSAATTTIPTMPRIRGRLDFRAGAGGATMFGMAGWAMAGGAKAWGEAATGAGGVAAVCPNVS